MGARSTRIIATATAAIALLAGACVETTEVVEAPATTGGVADATADLRADMYGGEMAGEGPVVTRFAGQELSFGTVPAEPIAADPDAEPIVVGMINQENTPLGSFPEVRLGAEAAIEFINTELGGVDGRPIELVPCITTFSPEKSQACAQEMVQAGAVAVLGGLDITSNGSIPVLEQNELAYVGGIPINLDEMTSPISFQFSGGSPGAFAAFADHAIAQGADRVVVAYGDFAPIQLAAIDYGADLLRAKGVSEVVELPFPITTTDFLPILQRAADAEPDAIFIGAADTACAPAMRTAHDLRIEATLYLVGACAAPAVTEEVGIDAARGRLFNVEGPIDTEDVEGQLYLAAVGVHGDSALPAASAATVSFRAAMNLYAILAELGADDISRESVIEAFRATVDQPSFNGHPYTCDGQQIPELPSLCSPHQILTEQTDEGLVPITDWIDVPALVRGD